MATMADSVQAYMLFVITGLIGIPSICYTGYQLHKNWNEQYMVRRRRTIILIIFILLSYTILIEFPFYAFKRVYPQTPVLCQWILSAISNNLRYGYIAFVLLRIFLLYYDHEYQSHLAANKWKILIDPEIKNTPNWFLENRHQTYGNYTWIITRILLPFWIIYGLIFTIFRYSMIVIHNPPLPFYYATDMGFVLFQIIFTIIIGKLIWNKYPRVADIWLIRQEITYSLWIILFAIICIAVILAILLIIQIPAFLSGVMIFSMGIMVQLYVMIVYPQKSEVKREEKEALISIEQHDDITWKKLIATKYGYESFANFLTTELATENLLFVTEYAQLKDIMLQKPSLKEKLINHLRLEYDLNLPQSLPLSSIAREFKQEMENMNTAMLDNELVAINEDKASDTFVSVVDKLYKKYIHFSAPLCVNISSSRKKEFSKIFENESVPKTIENVMPILEKCVLELSTLLNDSRIRFGRKNEYTEVAIQLKNKSDSNLDL